MKLQATRKWKANAMEGRLGNKGFEEAMTYFLQRGIEKSRANQWSAHHLADFGRRQLEMGNTLYTKASCRNYICVMGLHTGRNMTILVTIVQSMCALGVFH